MPRYARPLSAAAVIKVPKISFHFISTVLVVTPVLIGSFGHFFKKLNFLVFLPIVELGWDGVGEMSEENWPEVLNNWLF